MKRKNNSNEKVLLSYSVERVEVDGRKVQVLIRDCYRRVYMGEARCNETDKFDLVYGVALAEKRAILEMLTDEIDIYENEIDQLIFND